MNSLGDLSNDERVPLIGNFEITRKCMLNCLICYNDRQAKKELTLNEIKCLIDQLSDMGCLYLNLTGGDPLIHPNFVEIYKYVISKGIIPSVETSLAYLNEDIVKAFKEYSPDKLFISLYGIDKQKYQMATQSKVNPDDVLNNILLLNKNNIPFKLRTPVTKINLDQVGKIAKFARENNIIYKPTIKIFWKQSGERCDEYRCLPENIEEYRKYDKIYEFLYVEALKLCNNEILKKDCCTGIHDFNINAYGELNYCITFWKPLYDLKKGSFKDAWENWYPLFRRKENDYCLGKKIFRNDEYCPWGNLYSNKNIDTSLSLVEHAKNAIDGMLEKGIPIDQINEKYGITPECHQFINKCDDQK